MSQRIPLRSEVTKDHSLCHPIMRGAVAHIGYIAHIYGGDYGRRARLWLQAAQSRPQGSVPIVKGMPGPKGARDSDRGPSLYIGVPRLLGMEAGWGF